MARRKKRAISNAQWRFRDYKDSARKRGLPFRLSFKRFFELTQQACFVCGSLPANSYNKGTSNGSKAEPFVYNGIDRIDNSRGYVAGNVAPCCGDCNYAKGKKSLQELLLYIYRAYNFAIRPALQEGQDDE